MLLEIKCDKLIEESLKFHEGLNSVIGADDAHNSIGKSSILMLIDFVFGGDDFITKCDDIFTNVGHMNIFFTFSFEREYMFMRGTEKSNTVLRLHDSKLISIDEFRDFLQEKYLSPSKTLSFRDCVGPFLRIYQKNNYNEKRPLDSFLREPWLSVRKRVLKLFNFYHVIEKLELKKRILSEERKDIQGAFNLGVVSKINKRDHIKNLKDIKFISDEIKNLKNAFSYEGDNIKHLVNKETSFLKNKKDKAFNHLTVLTTSLNRVEDNIIFGGYEKLKDLEQIKEFFPEADIRKITEIELFHKDITKIMKDKLSVEKENLLENISLIKSEIESIDRELLQLVGSKQNSFYLLEKLLDLDSSLKNLKLQNDFYEQDCTAKENISLINAEIKVSLNSIITKIELSLNDSMEKFINLIYKNHPISPTIKFEDKDYKFKSGDDRGTGKGFANMLSLDLALLDLTILPVIAHDSLLFKNMDVPAFENLIYTYTSFEKQIFISVDEIRKYSKDTQTLLMESKFLKLDGNRLAFNKKWKSKNN
ncbi:DUF2326 domain-containing protein [Pantoea agglomerans]|uniref:DUF2326 domain-containing protein n=1 Tax=Enterobacter agglomerans TaxID=549 RepID=UPI00320AA677